MGDWWSDRLAGKSITPKDTTHVRVGSTPPLKFTPTNPPPTPMEAPPTSQERYMATQTSADPNTQISMGEAIRMWKGGEAHRKEGNNTCPECGSVNVFSRMAKGSGTGINGNNPAPRCFECGWNGMYDQGIEANWIS
tara:strand:+ start:1835 stop:2245 length:411 start_codon:yes stop_codon:yes gene_type:complete